MYFELQGSVYGFSLAGDLAITFYLMNLYFELQGHVYSFSPTTLQPRFPKRTYCLNK